jgi:hypothetical protein
MNKSIIIEVFLIFTILLSCESRNKKRIDNSKIFLHHVNLCKNSIEGQYFYFTAEYAIVCKDSSFDVLFETDNLFLNDKRISIVSSEVNDTRNILYLYVIYSDQIDSAEFIKLIERPIIGNQISLHIKNKKKIRINCSKYKGAAFLPPHQPVRHRIHYRYYNKFATPTTNLK